MSEFIKKWLYVTILSIGILGIVGCTGESSGKEHIRESIRIDAFANDDNRLYIYYSKGSPGDKHKMAILESNSTKWVYKKLDTSILDTSTIVYADKKVIVKEKGVVVFEDILPDVSQIEESLGFELNDYVIKYTPFRVGKNFSWDRKTHIVSVGVNKYSNNCHAVEPCFESMYYLSAINDDNHWSVSLIYKEDREPINISSAMQVKKYVLDNLWDYEFNVQKSSTDENKSFQFGDFFLHNVNGNIIRVKNNDDNKNSILSFWHEGNQHVFHDLDHFDKNRGKYMLYEMYTKENPKVPINQQKIYWEPN